MAEKVVLFIRPGDPGSETAIAYLQERKVEFTPVDISADARAAQLLLSRVGQIVVPTFLIGDKMIVGFDPVQLARYLPKDEPETAAVSFGAAVRSVTADIAKARGLPYAYGVEVGNVKASSPAAEAGIEQGDLITQIGAYSLTGGEQQFRTAVAARRPGDAMTLTVLHGSDDREVTVQFPAEEGAEPEAAVSGN